MAKPKATLGDALEQVAPSWDDARTERTRQGVHHKRAQRRTRTWMTASAAVLLLAGGAVALFNADEKPAPPSMAANEAGAITGVRTVSFADGSQAMLLDGAARVVVDRASDTAIDVRLTTGRARFEVAPRKERAFRVVCDQVVVQVLGTGFELERDGARTHVKVLHGRVAVSWPGGATELGAGQGGWFPASTPPAPATTPVEQVDPETPQASSRERVRATTWRQHAEQGEFQEAYRMLDRERTRVSDDVEELLLAADAARLSGHASEAVPYLQRIVDRHTADPRAPLAAFTLGGVLMNQLGRPREAEAAYARARSMSPSSALSQDALARQVEAAHRASDAAAARALALEYLERYPDGRRVQAVRRFGGLP